MPGVAGAGDIDFRLVYFRVSSFYDLDSRLGITVRPRENQAEDELLVWINGSGPATMDADPESGLDFGVELPVEPGTPLSFRASGIGFPGEGKCVSGFTWFAAHIAGQDINWIVPTRGTELIESPWRNYEVQKGESSLLSRLTIQLTAWVAHSRQLPSLIVDDQKIFDNPGTTVTVTAEYLLGNVLQSLVSDSYTYPLPSEGGPFNDFELHWGDHATASNGSNEARFGLDVPFGPMRVHLKVDGFTTETIRFDIEDDNSYLRDVLITSDLDAPMPGAGPFQHDWTNFATPSPGVIRRSIADVMTCGCVPTFEIEPRLDANDDTVLDAADFVRVAAQAR